jgi:hypothetical protein
MFAISLREVRLTSTKSGYVAALRQLDDDRVPSAFGVIVLSQPGAKPCGFATDGRILFLVKPRPPSKNLDPDQGFLEFASPPVQLFLSNEPKEARQALIPGESRACQDAFQMLLNNFRGNLASRHRS